MRVFLVDDEPLALKRLSRLLEATGRVEIVGQSTDPVEAVASIAASKIDLVFLDISMPELDGFGVAVRLPPTTMIVFTTAHDEHALRAFEVNAIDYLLKPIRDEDLRRALDKLERLRSTPDALAAMLARIAAAGPRMPEKIASRLGEKIQLIELERITHFIAEDKLTYAHSAGKSYVVDASITDLEERYPSFFRIHRSTLVRLDAIVELHATRVRLADGTELPIARERVRSLKDRLGL
jgi:two-component system LytT family response regulator